MEITEIKDSFQGVKSHYDYNSWDYLKNLNEKKAIWYYDILLEILKHKPQEVFELGCGNGDFTKLLYDNGVSKITAVDYSDVFLQYAISNSVNKKIQFCKLDLNNLELLENKIKKKKHCTFVSIDVVEHLWNKDQVLQTIISNLTKGSMFILQCPNLYSNVLGINYQYSIKNILIKFFRALKGNISFIFLTIRNYFLNDYKNIEELKHGSNYTLKKNLDYKYADEDAIYLTSGYWFLLFFKQHKLKIKKYTTFSFPTKHRWIKKILNLFSFIPFLRHLGGKMIFVVEK